MDEVLEPAWQKERLRALTRLFVSNFGRATVFVFGLLGFGAVTYVLFGMVFPWTFYAFIGGLVLVCAKPRQLEMHHLRRRAGHE